MTPPDKLLHYSGIDTSAPDPGLKPSTGAFTVVVSAVCIVGLTSFMVLAGWVLDIRALKSVVPHFTTMKPNTAVCLGLLAAAVWLSRTKPLRRRHVLWISVLAAVAGLIGVITLCEYAFDWNAGIDELLFRDPELWGSASPPGRLAPGAGICLALLSTALIVLDSWPLTSHTLTLVTVLVALVGSTGYLYDLPSLYGSGRYTSLAVHTVGGLLALCIGILASRPDRGLTALLVQSPTKDWQIRSLVAGAVLLPLVLGSLVLRGQKLGWYQSEFTLALFSVLLVVLSVALVWVTGLERERLEQKRLQAEKDVRESEERFRAIADNIPNLAWMATVDGSVFWYNQRWYEYTGKTPEQMRGRSWQEAHEAETSPAMLDHWQESLATGAALEMVFPLRGADGVTRPFLTRVRPVKGQNGRIVRWFGSNTDISAERATQEELRKANRELEEYAFVSSHDLQEPLRMVSIYTGLLMRELGDKLDAKTRKYAYYVQDRVKRAEQLIQDLMDFSRTVTTSETDSANMAADLNASLQEALAALLKPVEETNALITASRLPVVCGDETQLAQVFQNLLSNSFRYRKQDGLPRVDISARQDGANWIVSVQDNGIGFDQQYAERIFGLFKRLHRKEEYPGTGLGLTICQRIIERYHGRIWAEGTPGKGATFYFSLPGATKAAVRDRSSGSERNASEALS